MLHNDLVRDRNEIVERMESVKKKEKTMFCQCSQVSLALGLDAAGWGALVERAGNHSASPSPLLAHSAGFAGLASLARRCGVCLATFPSAWLLERHALLQHAGQPNDDKPFTCEQCGQRYRYRSAYVKHREQNHRARLPADKLFTCDVCGMQFRYLKSFKKHRLNHALERLQRGTGEQGNNNNSNGTGSSSSISSLLSRVERSDQVSSTGEPSQLDTGSNQGDPEDVARGESFGDNAKDEAISETASVQENQDLQEVQAMDLGISSGLGTSISGANPTTAGGGRAESEHGDVEESNVENLADELELRSAEANERVISLVSSRAHHHESDRRERRFACPFCGKCVRSKENLKLHVRKHTGERPFVCLFCGRAFGGKSDLTRHLRIHTGERPYHCEMCGKCFARADYLSKHLTTHIHHNHQR